jgi:hypothetical protein
MMKAFASAFLLVASLSFAQDPPDFIFATGTEAVRDSIESYCRNVDALTSRMRPILLVANDETPSSLWHQRRHHERTQLDLSLPLALVWTIDGHVIAMKLWTPELEKRFHPVSYCFRLDGSAARVVAAQRISPPGLSNTMGVGREWMFDENGKTIFEAFDRHDSSPLKSETTYRVYPRVPVYKHVRDLPFLGAITNHRISPI